MPELNPTAAAPIMRVFDQAREARRFDETRSLPPDGRLQRDELPVKAFEAIDRLEVADGAISEAELARALARLSAADRALVQAETTKATERLTGVGRRFGAAFGGFALGGLALAGGLVLSGPVGLGLAAVGAAGVLGGFGWAVKGLLDGGREGKRLAGVLDEAFSRTGL